MTSRPRRPSLPSNLRQVLTLLHNDERGQAMTEYTIILVGIALVAVALAGELAELLVELLAESLEGMEVITSNLE
jgi:Flp pilus assembly pilin Flp